MLPDIFCIVKACVLHLQNEKPADSYWCLRASVQLRLLHWRKTQETFQHERIDSAFEKNIESIIGALDDGSATRVEGCIDDGRDTRLLIEGLDDRVVSRCFDFSHGVYTDGTIDMDCRRDKVPHVRASHRRDIH